MIKNPSVIVAPSSRVPKKASRLDLVVLELAPVKKGYPGLPQDFWNFRVFIEAEVGQGGSRGLHYPPGRAGGPWRALVPSGPHRLAPMCSFGSVGVFCLKKSPKSFVAFGLHLVLIF